MVVYFSFSTMQLYIFDQRLGKIKRIALATSLNFGSFHFAGRIRLNWISYYSRNMSIKAYLYFDRNEASD